MYHAIRLFVLLIIGLCFYFFRKRKGAFKLKRSKKDVIIRVVVTILIMAIVFIPYESPFIRFDSAEASVRYSTMYPDAQIKTVETDKSAFCVSHRYNNFYYNTVTKFDDKYGFCNRHSQIELGFMNTYFDDENFHGIFDVTKLVNKEANEKCYMIKFLTIGQSETEDISIYDEHNAPIEKLTFSDNRTIFPIVMKQIDEKAAFVFNGKTYELD